MNWKGFEWIELTVNWIDLELDWIIDPELTEVT